jgi:hypothetical protein
MENTFAGEATPGIPKYYFNKDTTIYDVLSCVLDYPAVAFKDENDERQIIMHIGKKRSVELIFSKDKKGYE